jgi:integrase
MIWDLRVFIQYVRSIKDPKLPSWVEFRAICAAIFMVFVPMRPCALVRMNTAKTRIRPTDRSYIVPAREKTNFGREVTELVFRHANETNLSAAWYYEVGIQRAISLGCPDALFCSDKGVPYSSPDVLCKGMTNLLYIMGIYGYTSYSFRHALIQALFDAGLTETQVNAYTGHSNKSHTAVTWYYHLDKHWAGEILHARPSDRIALCEEAKRTIAAEEPAEGENL